MAENPTFQIPRDVIEPIIQAQIATAVSVALAGREQIIEKTVSQLLTLKVNSDGKQDSYSCDRGQPWITWAMNDVLKRSIHEILTKELAKHESKIREEIAHQLSNRKSPLFKQLVEQMCGSLVKAATSQYRLTVSVESEK